MREFVYLLGELDEKASYPRSGNNCKKGSVADGTGSKDDESYGCYADEFGRIKIIDEKY